jgi:hypothetical protein
MSKKENMERRRISIFLSFKSDGIEMEKLYY